MAACHVSQEIMDQAIDLTYRMEKDKTISSDAALIIRSAHAVRTYVFEKTCNNPSRLTEDTIKDIISEYVKRESQPDIQAAVEKAVTQATDSLNKQHNTELNKANDDYIQLENQQREYAIMMRSDAEKTARKYAEFAGKATHVMLFIIWLALMAGSVYCWATSGIITYRIAAIILSILSLLQIADYLLKFVNIPQKASKYVRDRVFMRLYDYEIKKRERYSHMTLRI